jgi:hypothetical protein
MELKLKSNKKIFFSIIGLPRSGTTLVSNMFNSFDNGFSISEPHWAFMKFRNRLRFGKIQEQFKPYWNNDLQNIIPSLKTFLQQENYNIGGFKETYDSNSKRILYPMNKLIDIMIFVFRNPIYCMNSQKKENQKHDINKLIDEYKKYIELYNQVKQNRKTFKIQYEDICSNKEDYFNKIFKDVFEIDKIELTKSKFILGDDRAHISTTIGNPVKQTTFLTPKEIEKIRSEIRCSL